MSFFDEQQQQQQINQSMTLAQLIRVQATTAGQAFQFRWMANAALGSCATVGGIQAAAGPSNPSAEVYLIEAIKRQEPDLG